jgi:hypothetical protein
MGGRASLSHQGARPDIGSKQHLARILSFPLRIQPEFDQAAGLCGASQSLVGRRQIDWSRTLVMTAKTIRRDRERPSTSLASGVTAHIASHTLLRGN